MIEAIVFDMDGTLWDSVVPVVDSWNQELAEHYPGTRPPIAYEEERSLMGQPMDVLTASLFPMLTGERQQEVADACYAAENAYLAEHGAILFPALRETLEVLAKRFRLMIVSNCQRGYIDAFLQAHQMGDLFCDHQCFGDNQLPKWENIRLILERNGISSAVYVGDTQGDCDASAAAGVPFIYARYGFGQVDRWDAVIDTPADLLKLDILQETVPEQDALVRAWREEEAITQIHGWDFSHIEGRHVETPPPWSYAEEICKYLRLEMRLLDIDTGGGEFLLTLSHPLAHTWVTEGYGPNVALCREKLSPLGITVKEANAAVALPFPDESFDLVIDRHGDYNVSELWRVLRPGGIFVTKQVGADNDRELVELLLPGTSCPYPDQRLAVQAALFREAGFEILREEESFQLIRFFDVGALCWFAGVLPWEFPGFSVDRCLDGLLRAEAQRKQTGCVEGTAHRFLLTVRKPAHGQGGV